MSILNRSRRAAETPAAGRARWSAALLIALAANPAAAFFNNDRWINTAAPPFTAGPTGTSATLTWGLAADGAAIPSAGFRSNNLISRLDSWFGSGGGGAIENRPWFGFFESSMDAWEAVSGVDFVYEPADDGATLDLSTGGVQGVRADIRFAGARIDGTASPGNEGTLAFAEFADEGDIILDTDDQAFYLNPANNAFNLRNILMHEVGHSLGLGHVTSSTAAVLMEPFFQLSIDGPQMDDIRGVQFLYGDALEKGVGNNTLANATPLGLLAIDTTATVGADAADNVASAGETDFVSISNSSDADYFAFTVDESTTVDIVLDPLGGAFQQTPEGGSSAFLNTKLFGNLNLQLLDADDGSVIESADAIGAGFAESILEVDLMPGEYAVRVAGTTTETQLYQLDIAVAAGPPIVGDYNGDGFVDAADYTVFRETVGSATDFRADSNGDNQVNFADYIAWALAYGGPPGAAPTAVPEPASGGVLMTALLLVGARPRRESTSR